MSFKRPFAPGFINRWDEKLLLNRPDTWSSRAHLVLYYAILFIVVLAGICFIVPDDPRTGSNAPLWITLVSLVAFIAFIVWLIYLLRFNVFKRYGNLEGANALKTFLLYFLSIALMVICTIVPPVVESIRANIAFTSEELVSDINAINTKVVQLERDSIPSRWDRDTFLVVNSIKGRDIVVEDDDYVVDTTSPGTFSMRKIMDTAEFNARLMSTDSLQKLNDSVYVFFECPDYNFVDAYSLSQNNPGQVLSSVDLYHRILVNYQKPDKQKTLAELQAILKKYNLSISNAYAYYTEDFDRDYMSRIISKYDLSESGRSINNIAQKKYRWNGFTISIVSRIFYYITLGLTLLVFVFRRTSVRTFFLTLLAITLLTIITSLIIAFFGLDFLAFLVICLVYYVMFLVLSISQSASKTRNVFSGIALNLTVFMTVFIPLIVVALYYAILREKYRHKDEPVGLYDHELEHHFYAEIIGLILLLAMVAILFKKLYRAWFAFPEQ